MTLFYTYIAYFEDDTFQSVGVTTNLKRRFLLLKQIGSKKGKECCKLVYYEEYNTSNQATQREDKLKVLPKLLLKKLILENNPSFVNILTDN